MNRFNDSEQEKLREPEKSFIPAPNASLGVLAQVRGDFVASVQRRCPQNVATLIDLSENHPVNFGKL